MLKNKKDLENENRLENLKELLRAMQDYDNLQSFWACGSSNINRSGMGGGKNKFNDDACNKGLEFDVVFLPGWEEVFPHQNHYEGALPWKKKKTSLCGNYKSKRSLLSFAMKRAYQWRLDGFYLLDL